MQHGNLIYYSWKTSRYKDVSNPRYWVKLAKTLYIIFQMHQSMDMVSVATLNWLMKMIKSTAVLSLENQEWCP